MGYFKLFQQKSKFFFVYLGLLGIINSVWASALLLLINNKITGNPLPFYDEYDWGIYVMLLVVSFAIAYFFQSYMIKLTYRLGTEMGLQIYDKVRFASYSDYLSLTEEKVRTAGNDVRKIQNFPVVFMESFNALIMVVIGIGYLFWVNAVGAGIVLGVLVALAIVYIYRNQQIEEDTEKVRDLSDMYMQNINDFLRGFREVKMSSKRSDNIFTKHISKNRHRVKDLMINIYTRALGNELLGSYVWYLMIGLVLFALPLVITMNLEVKTNFLVTLLFLMGPVATIVGVMEEYIKMSVAMSRLKKFDKIIDSSTAIKRKHGDMTPINESFEGISFENVTYEYFDKDGNKTFELQPLNIDINKGESIFITGGNGSGKSTFISLLSGLHIPKEGSIYMNGHQVTEENIAYYRDQLSCVFTDNYLFNINYDELELNESNEKFRKLLRKMELEKVITFDGENNKVSHTLSKGQQKRMALIYSMLDDKDIFIFDEWAAEQDPLFRGYFYNKIIPELRSLGKTVIAVTHDDAYFHCAGRLIKFDYGQIVKDEELSMDKVKLREILS